MIFFLIVILLQNYFISAAEQNVNHVSVVNKASDSNKPLIDISDWQDLTDDLILKSINEIKKEQDENNSFIDSLQFDDDVNNEQHENRDTHIEHVSLYPRRLISENKILIYKKNYLQKCLIDKDNYHRFPYSVDLYAILYPDYVQKEKKTDKYFFIYTTVLTNENLYDRLNKRRYMIRMYNDGIICHRGPIKKYHDLKQFEDCKPDFFEAVASDFQNNIDVIENPLEQNELQSSIRYYPEKQLYYVFAYKINKYVFFPKAKSKLFIQ